MAATAISVSTNANISATTRDLFLSSIVNQVFLKRPLLAKLALRRKMTWKGGPVITRPVDTAEIDSVAQSYAEGDTLSAERKATLTRPWFTWKYFQVPLAYSLDEFIQNGGDSDTQVINFSEWLVKKGQTAARIKLYKMMYDADTSDSGTSFQSVVQALNHDATYGHVSRATTVTNMWFQGASMAEDYADQDTAYTMSINLFRRMLSAADMHVEDPANYLFIVGPANYLILKGQVDGSNIQTNPGELVKYGFQSFTLDGVEIVKDPYLRAAGLSDEDAPQKWAFLINVNDWEFRLHPQRSFAWKPFTWQGDRADGTDSWLARILVAGNLCCWRPRGSIWLSDAT